MARVDPKVHGGKSISSIVPIEGASLQPKPGEHERGQLESSSGAGGKSATSMSRLFNHPENVSLSAFSLDLELDLSSSDNDESHDYRKGGDNEFKDDDSVFDIDFEGVDFSNPKLEEHPQLKQHNSTIDSALRLPEPASRSPTIAATSAAPASNRRLPVRIELLHPHDEDFYNWSSSSDHSQDRFDKNNNFFVDSDSESESLR